METIYIESFEIIGVAIKTSNNDLEKLQHDMQDLWNKFITENIAGKIPNKISNDVYCVYSDYEGDYTKPYIAVLGYKVGDLNNIPTGLSGKSFTGGKYIRKVATGNLFTGIVYDAWKEIWALDILRTYHADFEIYGVKASNPKNAEVEILVGIK
jgi:predicted transcriptional regulator YdeE